MSSLPESDKSGFGRQEIPALTHELAFKLHAVARNLPTGVRFIDLAQTTPSGEFADWLEPWCKLLLDQNSDVKSQLTIALNGLHRRKIETIGQYLNTPPEELKKIPRFKDGRLGFLKAVFGAETNPE
jgi:hypothetical protein